MSPYINFQFCHVFRLMHSSLFILLGHIGHGGHSGFCSHKTRCHFVSLHMNCNWKHCLSFSQMEAGRICLTYRRLVYASIFMDISYTINWHRNGLESMEQKDCMRLSSIGRFSPKNVWIRFAADRDCFLP